MLKKWLSIAAIWILVISCWVVVPASSTEKSTAWVGILTPQDIIIPVGIFQAGKWKTSWPEAGIDGDFNDTGRLRRKTLPLDKVPAEWLPDGKEQNGGRWF